MNEEEFIAKLKETAGLMQADGVEPDRIQQFIDQKKNEWSSRPVTEPEVVEKTEAAVEETAPVVAEDTELQLEPTSSELLGKVVRVKRKGAPNGYDEYSYEEIEKQIANKDFRPGQKPFENVEAYVEAFKGKAQLVDLTGSDSSALVDSKDRKPVDVVDFEEGPSVPVDDFVEDVDAIQGFEKINKLTFEEDNNLVENYVNTEEYAQDASFITEGINFSLSPEDLKNDIEERFDSNFGKNDPFIINFDKSVLDLKKEELNNKESELKKKYNYDEATGYFPDKESMDGAQNDFIEFQSNIIKSARQNSVGYQSRAMSYKNSFNNAIIEKEADYSKSQAELLEAAQSKAIVDSYMPPMVFPFLSDSFKASIVGEAFQITGSVMEGGPGFGLKGKLETTAVFLKGDAALKEASFYNKNTFEGNDAIIMSIPESSYTPVRLESGEYKRWLKEDPETRSSAPPEQFNFTVVDTEKKKEAGQYIGSPEKRFEVTYGSLRNKSYFDTLEDARLHFNAKGNEVKKDVARIYSKTEDIKSILDKIDNSPEFTDENGNYVASKFNAKNLGQVVGKTGVQMLTSVVSLGTTTYAQEAGSMFSQILQEQAIKKHGELAMSLMTEDEKVNAYIELSKNGEIDYGAIEKSASVIAGIDLASTLVGFKAAGAAQGSIIRNLIQKNWKGAIKEGTFVSKKVLGAGLLELPTEVGQELISDRTVKKNTRDMAGMYLTGDQVKLMKETAVQAFFGSAGTISIGNVASRGIKHVGRNIGKNSSKYKVNKDVKAIISELDVLVSQSKEIILEKQASGDITQSEANQQLKDLKSERDTQITAIYEAQNIVQGSKYSEYENEERKEALALVSERQQLNEKKEKINNEVQQKKEDGFYGKTDAANTDGKIKIIEDQLKELGAKQTVINAKQHYKYSGKKMREYINNNPDKFNGSKAYTFKTKLEAEEFLKRKLGKDFDPSSDNTYAGLLNGEVFGLRDDSNKLIIDVEENIFNEEDGLENILVGSNVVHHEGAHALMSTLSDSEINDIRNQLELFLENSGDVSLKAIDLKTKKRIESVEKQRVSDEEFITSVSDFLRTYSIKEGDVQTSAELSKLGGFIAKYLNVNAPDDISFSGLENGSQTLEFLKKYNQFNGTGKFKFSTKGVSTKDTELEDENSKESKKENVASEKITKDVFFEDGSINKEFQQYTYDGKKNNAPSSFHAQAAYAYEPLARGVVENISKSGFGISNDQDQFIIEYFSNREDGETRKEAFVSDLTFGPDKNKASSLLGIAKSFNPAIGSFGGHAKAYLAVRAIRVFEERTSKQVTEGAQTLDAPESMQVAGEDQQIDTTDTRSTSEKLGFDNAIKNEAERVVKQAVQDASNKLSGKDISDKKKANLKKKSSDKFIEDRILPLVKKAIGKNTKNEKAFTNFVSKVDEEGNNSNFEVLRDLFLDQIDVQKGSGPAALWNIDNPPSLEEFLDYYEGSGTTKSDRRSSLARAVSRSIASEARLEFAKKDPATAKLFKEEHGVVLASEKLILKGNGDKFITKLNQLPGWNFNSPNPASKVAETMLKDLGGKLNFKNKDDINKFFDILESVDSKRLPKKIFGSASVLRPGPRMFGGDSSKKRKTAEYKELNNLFETRRKKFLQSEFGEFTGPAANWTAKKYGDYFGTTEKELELSAYKVDKFNEENASMFEQTWQSIFDIISEKPEFAAVVERISQTSEGASSWMRLGAEYIGYSKNPKGSGKKLYEWEHAMQANNVRFILMQAALDKVKFNDIFPKVRKNFKLIALDKAYDNVLGDSGRKNSMGLGWDFITGSYTQRYFDPHVVAQGGIDPTTIVDFNGQNFADKYQIDSNGHSTKAMASAKLNEDFNNMLERVKGVKSEAVYSEDRANKIASGKKGLKFFVPYSAEDFVGLIYPTLGKGKEGDRNLQWYKDNLLDPYAIAMSNFEKAKQEAMRDWADLKNKIKSTPAALGKDAVRGFSNEEALRVYLWDQIGAVPSTLAQKDVDALVAHIEGNKTLKDFADNVNNILGAQGYPPPTGDWLAGTLTTDLINNVNTVKRAEFLQQWKDNVDVVYSKDNMNKLKAIYGERYTEALENILHRMETGRNRPGGGTRLENQWLDWVNNSVGTVMFFNTRSALLQTISSINFLNWSFNNPLMAAKAFANQPQFWKDFSSLFNSDFLKQRRSGLKNDVNADEIAKAAASSTNKVKAAMAAILKAGFLPTQMADSFAIAIGGASFYRNRVNSLVKEGMTKEQAMEQAMMEFQETAEESQQSSRPDRVSMQQAGGLGRVVLAFANTPMQYTRLTKKAALDLVNGRGDWKTNMSKLLYYGAVQNIIFTALQQAMFAMAFDDESDEDEKEAMAKIANGVADTLLRGTGVYGAAATTVKNIVLEAIKQQKSKRTDYTKAALKSLTLSPPIDTKVRKLMSAARAFTYKQSLKDMKTKGASVDNPAALAAGQVISAAANVPIDRFIIKARNIKGALDQQNETWQQIALALGYSEWQLGIEKDKSKTDKTKAQIMRELKKSDPFEYKLRKAEERREKKMNSFGDSPNKKLDNGVAGVANRDGTIEVDPNLSPVEHEKTVAHEEQHVKDMASGKLDYDDKYVYWNGAKYARVNGKIKYKGKSYIEGHKSLPWEKKAYAAEPSTSAVKRKLY
jgi:hypothetical protein